MKLIVSILKVIFLPIYSSFLLRKHKGIWGLKNYLQSLEKPSPTKIKVYDRFFAKYGAWIGYNSLIDGVPNFPHGYYGIFISGSAVIGKNSVIFQQVTIGSNTIPKSKNFGAPQIGENVLIGAGAKIIGKVIVNNNCRIGANAVVYDDMPENSVAVQSPTRVIQKVNLDNRHFSKRGDKWFFLNDNKWIEEKKNQK